MKKKIILMDGRKLQIWPKESWEEKMNTDTNASTVREFTLDTTGRYLTLQGHSQDLGSKSIYSVVLNKYNHSLFMENAWFLLDHAEEILGDSRMMFTPVRFTNGMAYTGTSGFEKPTVGGYLEWWLNFPKQSRDINGDLIWYISGSPLTGANACSSVTPECEDVSTYSRTSFVNIARSFIEVNGRYADVKEYAEVYTLEELLVRLHGESYRLEIVDLKHRMMEEVLTTWLNQSRMEVEEERDKYNRLLSANRRLILDVNRNAITDFTSQYISRENELRLIPDRKSKEYRDARHTLSSFGQSFLKKITGKNPNSINLHMILSYGRKELKRSENKKPIKPQCYDNDV